MQTDDDALDERDSLVTATLTARSGYTIGSASSASVTVEDNNWPTVTVHAGPSPAGEANGPAVMTLRRVGLIDPAVRSTRNVLGSVNITQSVRRVVLTSSMVAAYGDNADLGTLPGGVIDEAAWNTSSSLRHQPYAYSKTLAERTAWELADAQDRWQLVTINPSLLLGPCVSARVPEATSFAVIRKFADGSMKAGVPPYELGVV